MTILYKLDIPNSGIYTVRDGPSTTAKSMEVIIKVKVFVNSPISSIQFHLRIRKIQEKTVDINRTMVYYVNIIDIFYRVCFILIVKLINYLNNFFGIL
jgi:hypothetical protein